MPALSIERSENVATPFTAARVTVPPNVAPAAPVPDVIARVTLAVDVVIVLPVASWTVT